MGRLKQIVFLIPVCLAVVLFTSCKKKTPEPLTPGPSSSTKIVSVYFTYLPNFQVGTEPYEKSVARVVPGSVPSAQAVLEELFKGPTEAEKVQGLTVFLDGASGFSKLQIEDGVARIYLTGECSSKGAAYTIANLIQVNLEQFPEIHWIKIYDQNGETETPAGQSGSIPFCLEP